MSVIQRLNALENQLKSAIALYNGTRDKGLHHVIYGNVVAYGCKVTQALSPSDFYIGLSGDVDHINPDKLATPVEKNEYANTAFVYGEGFLMNNVNTLTITDPLLAVNTPPSTGFGRYDIVYLYVDYSGPQIGIKEGTASTACFNDFVANGLNVNPIGEIYDPVIPVDVMPIARIYVQGDDTGVADARITDLRIFKIALIGNQLSDAETAARLWATEAEDVLVNDGVNPTDYSSYHYAQKAKLLNVEVLTAIDAQINAGTVIDVFYYNPSYHDDDGGKWIEQTQHTAWYNETLNTATRGATRDFPKGGVVGIVEASKVTLHDVTDPSVPMWMVFNGDALNTARPVRGNDANVAKMKNGVLYIGHAGSRGVTITNFKNETLKLINSSATRVFESATDVSKRNAIGNTFLVLNDNKIINPMINGLAVTSDGNMNNTVAVATDDGFSVIHPGGEVYDVGYLDTVSLYANIEFIDSKLFFSKVNTSNSVMIGDIPHEDIGLNIDWRTDIVTNSGGGGSIKSLGPSVAEAAKIVKGALSTSLGLNKVDYNDVGNAQSIVYITKDYCSGWMLGDIRRAFLADSVAEIITGTELILNGDFSSSTANWTAFASLGAPVLSVVTGELLIDHNGSAETGKAIQGFTTVVGQVYTITADYIHQGDAGAIRLTANPDGTPSAGAASSTIFITSQTITLTYTAEATTTYVALICNTTNTLATAKFDNVTCGLAQPNRSDKAGSLKVYGSITKSSVAPGAELMSYSGWSATNHLFEPYSADLNFGTDPFYMMGWVKWDGSNPTESDWIIHRGTSTTPRFGIRRDTGGFLKGIIGDGVAQENSSNSYLMPDNIWLFFTFIRTQDHRIILYVNEELEDNTQISSRNVTGIAPLFIGTGEATATTEFNGELSLIRIGAGEPTGEQIRKIYNDEKFLFQDNVKCLINGASSNVLALAHDEITDELTVSTSGGLSTFKGLRRISKDVTKVNKTTLSAYNGILVDGE